MNGLRTLLAALVAIGLPLCPLVADFIDNEYTAGHADVFAVGYEDGVGFDLHVHVDDDAVVNGMVVPAEGEFEPGDFHTRVPDTTIEPRMSGTDFDFIGVADGENFYKLPQGVIEATNENAPFAGVGTEEIVFDTFAGNELTFELSNVVQAPGEFSLYRDPSTVALSTADGVTSFLFPTSVHEHYNWGFTEPGVYLLEITVSGTHNVDGFVTASDVWAFAVGDSTVIPEPSSITLLAAAGGLGLLAYGRRYRKSATA